MSSISALEIARKTLHHPIELRLRKELLPPASDGAPLSLITRNPENIRQGLNYVLGRASLVFGAPLAKCESIQLVETGPGMALTLNGGTTLFEAEISEPGFQTLARFGLFAKLKPGKLFGEAQALQWIGMAAGPLYKTSFAAVSRALTEPSDYRCLVWILNRLVEERVPLTDGHRYNRRSMPRIADAAVTIVLDTIAASGKAGSGETEWWKIVDSVRIALRENSARFYNTYYHLDERFDAGPAFLDLVFDPERRSDAMNSVRHYMQGTGAAFLVVAPAEVRRQLHDFLEGGFEAGKLIRPAIVISPAELPLDTRLPESTGELRLATI